MTFPPIPSASSANAQAELNTIAVQNGIRVAGLDPISQLQLVTANLLTQAPPISGVGVFNVLDPQYHVRGDGVRDDSAGINACAADAAAAGGVLYFPPGYSFYTGTTTVLITSACIGDGATILYAGTGVAIQVGTSAAALQDIATLRLPAVTQTLKTTTGWNQAGGADVGVRLLNLYASQPNLPHIKNFSRGLELRGEGRGCVYNTVTLGHLDNNKIDVDFSADATGWSNENVFISGRCSFNSEEGTNVAGTRFMRMQNTTNAVNNNRFIGTSMEGTTPEYYVECYGDDNYWIACRWEGGGSAKVLFTGTNAVRNVLWYGYQLNNVAITQSGGAARNVQWCTDAMRVASSNSAAGLVLENTGSDSLPVIATAAAGADMFSTNLATAYGTSIAHDGIRLKATADAFPRIQIAASNGQLRFTDGTVAPSTEYFRGFGSDGIQHVGTKLAFFAKTPVVQPASANQAAVAGTAGATYTATEQALLNNVVTLANALRTALVNLGLAKGSA